MLRDRYARIMEKQGIKIKWLGVYIVVILFVFALFIFKGSTALTKKQVETDISKSSGAPTVSGYVLKETKGQSNPSIESTKVLAETSEKVNVKSEDKSNINSNIKEEEAKEDIKPIEVQADITSIVWPLKGKIIRKMGLSYSQTFSDYRYHNGIDIEAKRGMEVIACMQGVVESVESSKSFNHKMVINHGNGWYSIYAHLGEVYVKKGDRIKVKTKIGSVGQPGMEEVLAGPHLHFSIKKGDEKKNPMDYLPK